MKKLSSGILLLHFFLNTAAEDFTPPVDDALANCSVSIAGSSSVFSNPAGISPEKHATGFLSAGNHYAIDNFNSAALAIVIPVTKNQATGITFSRSGIPSLSRIQSGICYAIQVHPKISGGIRVNYERYTVNEHPELSGGVFTGEAGLLLEPLRNFRIGMDLRNPGQSSFSGHLKERSPAELTVGIGRKFSDQVWLGIRASKTSDQNPGVGFGVEYHPRVEFWIRFGESIGPMLTCFGFGYRLRNFSMDFAAQMHPDLGVTSSCSLIFQFPGQ